MSGLFPPSAAVSDAGFAWHVSFSEKPSMVSLSAHCLSPLSVRCLVLPPLALVSLSLFHPLSLRAGTGWSSHEVPNSRTRPGQGPQLSLLLQQHSNASQSLCDIIRLSREQMIQVQDSPEPDQLLATLEKWVCRVVPRPREGSHPLGGPGS